MADGPNPVVYTSRWACRKVRRGLEGPTPKYHTRDCHFLGQHNTRNADVLPVMLAFARASGLEPCSRCKPVMTHLRAPEVLDGAE